MFPGDVTMNPAWWCLVCGDSVTERCRCGALCIFQGPGIRSPMDDVLPIGYRAARSGDDGKHSVGQPFSISKSFHLPLDRAERDG